MKYLLLPLLIFTSICFSQEKSNYTIIINGETFDYNLGEDFSYDVRKKGPLTIKVDQKELLNYNDGIISFDYNKDFPVSETIVEEGVKQITAVGSTGAAVLIQEYNGIDPSLMVDLMLNEVTKESKEYGYEEEKIEFEFTTKGNKLFSGKKATLTYQEIVDQWVVASYGWKDGGILVITMIIDSTNINKDVTFIEEFYNSLQILKN